MANTFRILNMINMHMLASNCFCMMMHLSNNYLKLAGDAKLHNPRLPGDSVRQKLCEYTCAGHAALCCSWPVAKALAP